MIRKCERCGALETRRKLWEFFAGDDPKPPIDLCHDCLEYLVKDWWKRNYNTVTKKVHA